MTLLCRMKQLLLTLVALWVVPPARAQLLTEPWFESSLLRPWSAWVQHAGPSPGWTQGTLAARHRRLNAGIQVDGLGFGAWTMATLKLGTPTYAKSLGPQVLTASAGLGWERRRPQVLLRATWGPWTLNVQPTAGRWSAGWRQLQTSGWTFSTQLRQDLAARQSEVVVGVERADLALYASSLGRWRLVFSRPRFRVTLGGGAILQHSFGVEAAPVPMPDAP